MNRSSRGISAFLSRHAAWLAFAILLLLAILNQLQVEVVHGAQTLGIARQTAFRELISKGDEAPTLASLDSPDLGYVSIGFDFLATDTGGSPNLFQTGRFNDGIRAEFAGNSLILVFPCEATANHLKSLCIADKLEAGRWYRLEFEALDGEFLNCRVSGFSPFRSRRDRPHFSARDIRVGTGFDPSRRFHGDLRHVTVTALNARTLGAARCLVYALQVVLMAAFAVTLYVFYRDAVPTVSKISSTARPFYDPLLTLRFVACLMVVAGHALMITHLPADLKTSLVAGSPAWLLSASPWGGLWIFFTLSGYLMGKGFYSGRYSADRAGVWNFYRNRLLRIVPLYWTSVLIVAALVHPDRFQLENLGDFLAILTFNCDSFASLYPIGALWSVRTEMQFYALVPFLYICLTRRLKSVPVIAALALAIIAGGIAMRTATVETLGWEFLKFEVYRTLLGNLDLFLLGFLANPLVQWLKPRIKTGKHLIELGMLLLVGTYVGLAWLSAHGGLLLVPEWRRVLFEMGPTLSAVATTALIVCFDAGPNDSGKLVARLGNERKYSASSHMRFTSGTSRSWSPPRRISPVPKR